MAPRHPRKFNSGLPPRPSHNDYGGLPPPPHGSSKSRRASFTRRTPPLSPGGAPPYGGLSRSGDFDGYEGYWDAPRESVPRPDYRLVDAERDSASSRAASSRHYYDPWEDYYAPERSRRYSSPPATVDYWDRPPPPPPPDVEYAPDYADPWEGPPRRDSWGAHPPSGTFNDPDIPCDPPYDWPYPPEDRRSSVGEYARDRSASFEPSRSWKEAHSRSPSLRGSRGRGSNGKDVGRHSWGALPADGRNHAFAPSASRDTTLPPRPDLPFRPEPSRGRGGPSPSSRRHSQSYRPNGLPPPTASLPLRPPVNTVSARLPISSSTRLPQPIKREYFEKPRLPPPSPPPPPARARPKSPGEVSDETEEAASRQALPQSWRVSEHRQASDDDSDSIQSSRASSRTPTRKPHRLPSPEQPTRPISRSSIASSRVSVKPFTPPTKAVSDPRLPVKPDDALPPSDDSPAPTDVRAPLILAEANGVTQQQVKTEADDESAVIPLPHARDKVNVKEEDRPRSPTTQSSGAVTQPTHVKEDTSESTSEETELGSTLLSTLPTLPASKDDIPELDEDSPFEERLRAAVITHLLDQDSTREDRVEVGLGANLSIDGLPEATRISSSPRTLVNEVSLPILEPQEDNGVESTLMQRMEKLQTMLRAKQERLREEYLALDEKWQARCARLDAELRDMPEPEIAHGRSTRRTAVLGDAVRSDLEMEQIIASLGVDDATNPDILSQRNQATIPDMIQVTQGHLPYSYNDNNLRVYDPQEYYAPDTGIHDWTESEKEAMVLQYVQTPKQFGYIADKLEAKTAEQCVDFYYLHKKTLLDFRKAVARFGPKKRGGKRAGKRKGNALLADIAQHDAEVREQVKGPIATRRTRRAQVIATEARRTSSRRAASQAETQTSATATPEPETGRTRRRKAPVTKAAPASTQPSRQPSPVIDKSVTPETTSTKQSVIPVIPPEDVPQADVVLPQRIPGVAQSLMLPTIPAPKPVTPLPSTSRVVEEAEDSPSDRPTKRAKRSRKTKKSAETIDDEMDEAAASGSMGPLRQYLHPPGWTDADNAVFLGLIQEHGMNFERIAAAMPGKTVAEITQVYNSGHATHSTAQSGGPPVKPDPDASTASVPAPSMSVPPMSMGIYGTVFPSMQPIPPYAPMYPPPPLHYARYPEYYPRDYWPPPPLPNGAVPFPNGATPYPPYPLGAGVPPPPGSAAPPPPQ